MFWFIVALVATLVVLLVSWMVNTKAVEASEQQVMSHFRDKVVWITGATSGIGLALAIQLHHAGARLILSARNTDKLQQLVTKTLAPSPQQHQSPHLIVPLDLSALDELPAIVRDTLAKVSVDIVVHNGGISMRALAVATELKVDRQLMDTNFWGAVVLTKALLPSMMARRSGQIIVISSLQGKIAVPGRSSYSASKHALQGYFDALRLEVEAYNVDVCIVSPGYVRTDLSKNALRADGSRHGMLDDSTARGFPPEFVARQIVNTCIDRRPDVLVASKTHTIAVLLKTVWTSVIDGFLRRKFAAELEQQQQQQRDDE